MRGFENPLSCHVSPIAIFHFEVDSSARENGATVVAGPGFTEIHRDSPGITVSAVAAILPIRTAIYGRIGEPELALAFGGSSSWAGCNLAREVSSGHMFLQFDGVFYRDFSSAFREITQFSKHSDGSGSDEEFLSDADRRDFFKEFRGSE